jgi:tricorn protease
MKKLFLLVLFMMIAAGALFSQQEMRLLRFPTIHDNQIVFTYAGDLYTVSSTGGVARKLTNSEGYECFPRFSDDGKWIAFTGQYDGNTEVYVIPSEGGIPKRLTYTATLGRDDVSDRMGPNNLVVGWKHDNKHVVFRSRMHMFDDFKGELYLASLDGDIPQQLPLPRGGFCSYSPDDSKLVYNRIFREFRTWKRYRGGMTDDIWIYDFASKKTENITNNNAGDIIPMWSGDKIYFLSDRDSLKRMNLYVYDLTSKETKKLTSYTDYDIKFPSLGNNAIVYENGGYIYRFDLQTEKAEKVPVMIEEDFVGGRSSITKVSDQVTNYDLSPDGKRALFGSRGDVFTVPAKNGVARNITNTPGVHERNAAWSPDGKSIAYISDATGEDEIYVKPQDGTGAATQITKGEDTYKYSIAWSPNSKMIMWADKKLRLRYVDVSSKEITEVAQAKSWEFNDYNWSPDSKWIAYAKSEVDVMNKIYLYSVETNKTIEATDGWYSSSQPAFSADGKYLFFQSSRDFHPSFSETEFNASYHDMARIYLVTLTKAADSPLKPKSDEVTVKEEKLKSDEAKDKDKKDKKEKKDAEPLVVVKVDEDGLKDRIVGLPIDPSSYFNIISVDNAIYYLRHGNKDEKTQLLMYDFGELKETNLGEVDGFAYSADLKKFLISKDRGYYIVDVPKAKIDLKDRLDLSGLEVNLDRHLEWSQIFNECWRQMKEFYFAPNMSGVDWDAVKTKYAALVPYVNHRADLTYILGEMIGELSTGHTYVGGGDYPRAKRLPMGLLGAQLERDSQSKYYRITKILKGENWDKATRSPLTEVGVNAKVGDYIIAVDGKSTAGMANIYESLVNKADKQVVLKLNSQPQEKGSRDVTVLPIANELDLYYYNWVEDNIAKVDKATNGKVGYIHIPDMSAEGLNEFFKHFYPQLTKKALIIDDRGNGGGNVSPLIIERLQREIAFVGTARNVTAPHTDPGEMQWGPKVLLFDEFSASDGDIFPYRFKKIGLGKTIGKRSWGGVDGIRGSLPLLDGGFLNKPEFTIFDADGKGWIVEGHGVDPDIVVDNDPAEEFVGNDQQLNRAIQEALDELKTQEKTLPPTPEWPIKK